MDCMFVFEGSIIAASLLGFSLLYSTSIWRRMKVKASALITRSENGAFRSESISESNDVIIVGAGVAGSALAYSLGKDGWRIHVIERDMTEPKRMVGELLQPGGYMKLEELGLEDCTDGIDAQKVFGCVLYMNGKETKHSYPFQRTGRSFHNGRSIQKMRQKAASLPNVKLEQGNVTSLLEENGRIKGVQYKTKAGQELTASAPLTVVCDGFSSRLRRFLGNPKNCVLPHPNHGHFIVTDSPILLYPVSNNEIRCLVDFPAHKVPSISNGEMAKYLKTEVAPQMPTELYDAFICAIDKRNMRTMPNRSMAVFACSTPGAFLIGDAMNMRHPFAGGRMTVALSDILLLRDLLRPVNDLTDAPAISKYLESFYVLRKPMAFTINTLADGLYTAYSASEDPLRKEMKEASFDYFSLRGVFAKGLMPLLSGIKPNPWMLGFHGFALAFYAAARLQLPFPSPKRLWIGARLIWVASGVMFPILKAEGFRATFFPVTMPAYYRTPPPLTIWKETPK